MPSPNRSSMYPYLHSHVSTLLDESLLDYTFHNSDSSHTCSKTHDTNIMGRFKCLSRSCQSTGWSSKMIAITIRLYPGNEYNARVYHQRCKRCNRLSTPILDVETYAERVANRIKKWEGIEMERPVYRGKSNGPHNRELCEGCKAGHCRG